MMDHQVVWVGVTILPEAKTAHVEAFDNQKAAEEYVEYARENAPDGATVWVESSPCDVTATFEP